MTAQLDLFGGEHKENLERVAGAIAQIVLHFCRMRNEFHMEELRQYVVDRGIVAPASPDRILRWLRQKGFLDYEVINRRDSLYRIKSVKYKPGTEKGKKLCQAKNSTAGCMSSARSGDPACR